MFEKAINFLSVTSYKEDFNQVYINKEGIFIFCMEGRIFLQYKTGHEKIIANVENFKNLIVKEGLKFLKVLVILQEEKIKIKDNMLLFSMKGGDIYFDISLNVEDKIFLVNQMNEKVKSIDFKEVSIKDDSFKDFLTLSKEEKLLSVGRECFFESDGALYKKALNVDFDFIFEKTFLKIMLSGEYVVKSDKKVFTTLDNDVEKILFATTSFNDGLKIAYNSFMQQTASLEKKALVVQKARVEKLQKILSVITSDVFFLKINGGELIIHNNFNLKMGVGSLDFPDGEFELDFQTFLDVFGADSVTVYKKVDSLIFKYKKLGFEVFREVLKNSYIYDGVDEGVAHADFA